jgi:hypothetical protein
MGLKRITHHQIEVFHFWIVPLVVRPGEEEGSPYPQTSYEVLKQGNLQSVLTCSYLSTSPTLSRE